MHRKLEKEDLDRLMEAGVSEFAEKGLDKANISTIAKKAGLSVGVLYNYFDGKDDFFLHCVRHAVEPLGGMIEQIEFRPDDLEENMRLILQTLFRYAREHNDYYVLYHEITSGGCRKFAAQLVEEVEAATAKGYMKMIEAGKGIGVVRQDMDIPLFAFFSDCLLMMIQFSMSCDYYKKRLELYCGEEPSEEKLIQELMKFVSGAFGIREQR